MSNIKNSTTCVIVKVDVNERKKAYLPVLCNETLGDVSGCTLLWQGLLEVLHGSDQLGQLLHHLGGTLQLGDLCESDGWVAVLDVDVSHG